MEQYCKNLKYNNNNKLNKENQKIRKLLPINSECLVEKESKLEPVMKVKEAIGFVSHVLSSIRTLFLSVEFANSIPTTTMNNLKYKIDIELILIYLLKISLRSY